jgi:HAD superfamily phosphoserine phosphatase-like hydrolase
VEQPDFSTVILVMDFDGTITTTDCLWAVLSRDVAVMPSLARAAREAGLSQTETLVQAVGQLRLPKAQLLAEFAEAAILRDGFSGFLAAVLERRAQVFLISAGFAEAIETVWRREELPAVPMLASGLGGDESLGYHLRIDERFGDCPICGKGMCKGPAVDALRRPGDLMVAFGDGARDLCMARRADLVFARDELAVLCQQESIAYLPLADFSGALSALEERLRERDVSRHSSQ